MAIIMQHRRFTHKQALPARRLRAASAGFTLVDVMAGMAIIGLVASSIIYGLNQLNHFAMVNRLHTAAQTLAQNQIDLILTMGPYDPSGDKYPVPPTCGTGTATNTILRTDQPYYYDPTATTTCPISTTPKNVTLYRDPMTPSTASPIYATIKSTITDTGMTVTVDGTATSLDLRRATVSVDFTYRNRNYSVVMETMRTSDQ